MSDEQSDVQAEQPADVVTPEQEQQAPEQSQATPVLQRAPSSESPTQQPEAAEDDEREPLSLEDAVRVLLIYVKGRRIVGDADLDVAIADVESALSAQDDEA